jgi:hypothetical protein
VLPGGKDNGRQRQREAKTTGGKDNVGADGEEILKETLQRSKRLACCQSVSSQSQAAWKAKASTFIVVNILASYLLPCAKVWAKL